MPDRLGDLCGSRIFLLQSHKEYKEKKCNFQDITAGNRFLSM